MDAMRACIRCGCYEPFQDITDECCFQRHGTSCVFLKPENAGKFLGHFGSPLQMDTINAQRKQDCNSSRNSLMSLPTCPLSLDKSLSNVPAAMSSLPQPVEVKDPGHALVTPGHAPVTTASTTPGHAPVDATLAYPALKKIRTLPIDVELTLMTLFAQRQSSTMPPLKCAYQPMATCYDGYQRSAGGC